MSLSFGDLEYYNSLVEMLYRKLRYLFKFGSTQALHGYYLVYDRLHDELIRRFSWSAIFRMIVDQYLRLMFGFEPDWLKYNPFKWEEFIAIPIQVPTFTRFCYSRFNNTFLYDVKVDPLTLEYWLWDLSYKWFKHATSDYKHFGNYAKLMRDVFTYLASTYGFDINFLTYMVTAISLAFAKIRIASFWDVAVWDSSVWSEDYVKTIHPLEPEREEQVESTSTYDSHWDFAYWDYSQWSAGSFPFKPEIGDVLDKKMEEFAKRIGELYATLVIAKALDRIHYRGSEKQLYLKYIYNKLSPLLDRLGVPATQKHLYFSFAEEIVFIRHVKYRKTKYWKQYLSEEDVVEKYVKLGLSRDVLNLIREYVLKYLPRGS